MNNNATLHKSQTDWERLTALADGDIDFSDAPELTDEQLAQMRPSVELFPALAQAGKQRITIQLDQEIVRYFEQSAEDAKTNYQTLINAALRSFVIQARGETDLRSLVREVVREEMQRVVG